MGLSSKKSKTTSSSSAATHSTATTQANVPEWLLNPAKAQAGLIGSLQTQGPAPYTPQTSALQKQAFDNGAQLQTGQMGFDRARDHALAMPTVSAPGAVADISADQVRAGSVLDGLDRYYNPFKDQVLNPVMDDFDQQAGQTRASQSAAAANGAFNSTRFGMAQSLTEGELARARAATQGGLLSDMFTQATGLSAGDKNRTLQADQGNQTANLAASQSNQSKALDIERLKQSGQVANQGASLQQAGLLDTIATDKQATIRGNVALQDQLGGEATTQGNAARQYPITYAAQMGGLLQGLDPEVYGGKTITQDGTETANSTSTTKSSDSLLGSLGQAAQIAALFI